MNLMLEHDLVSPPKDFEADLNNLLAEMWKPRERLLVDQWAEKNLVLSSRVTRMDGPLNLDRTPYARGPLRAFLLRIYSRMIMVFSPQTAKTLILQIIWSYCIDQDPGPAMFAYPSRDSAKKRSRKHLRNLLETSEVLSKHMTGRADDMQLFEYALDTMTTNIAWAGSPTSMAMESIRYLFRDEIAKWKHSDKSEAHPLENSAERVSSYDEISRIVDATTPTLKDAAGWSGLMSSTWHENWVPCPECGKPDDVKDLDLLVIGRDKPSELPDNAVDAEGRDIFFDPCMKDIYDRLMAAGFFVMRWENVKWDDVKDPDRAEKAAHCECPHCKAKIEHKMVLGMTQLGKWVPRYPWRDVCGFWLPSWYRAIRKRSFGQCVKRFLQAAGDAEKLQSVYNNDRCLPWEIMGISAKWEEVLLQSKRDYAPDTIPFTPLAIVCTADVRDYEIHYVVRAWGELEVSAQCRYGILPRFKFKNGEEVHEANGESLAALDPIRALTFKDHEGHEHGIILTMVDSGYDADEVYAYARTRQGVVASKGEDTGTQLLAYSKPEKDPATKQPRADSPLLVTYRTWWAKDTVAGKMRVTKGMPGEWMLHAETGRELAEHLVSEKKVTIKNKYGHLTTKWVKIGTKNHWWDCEQMQIAVIRFIGLRDMSTAQDAGRQIKQESREDARSQVFGKDFSGLGQRLRR